MDFKTPEKYFSFIPKRVPPTPRPPAGLEALLTALPASKPKALQPSRRTLGLPRGIQRGNT